MQVELLWPMRNRSPQRELLCVERDLKYLSPRQSTPFFYIVVHRLVHCLAGREKLGHVIFNGEALESCAVKMKEAAHAGHKTDYTAIFGVVMLALALVFVWRSFYAMRIPKVPDLEKH